MKKIALKEELYGGILECEKAGLKKSAILLRKSAVKPRNRFKLLVKNVLSRLSWIRSENRRNCTVAVLLGEEYLHLIKEIEKVYDIYLINPSSKLRKYCFENKIPFEFSPINIEKDFYNLNLRKENKVAEKLEKKLRITEKQLEKNHCKFMILPDDLEVIHRFYILAAKNKKIPSAVIQHGIMGQKNTVLGMYADFFWVWGDVVKQQYANTSDPSRIIVMGYPYQVNQELINKTGKKNRVLFIGQPYVKEIEDSVRLVYQICVKNSWEICYRPHPAENRKELINMYRDLEKISFSKVGLEQDLADAKVVVGLFSTVLMEALIYQKNVVQIQNLYRGIDFSIIGNMEIAKCNDSDLEKAIYSAMEEGRIGRLNKDWLYLNPQYAKSVIEFINGTIKNEG